MRLTGWYDGCQKPVRAGLYRRQLPASPGVVLWAVWNGEWWGCAGITQRLAIERSGIKSIAQCLRWRGIAGPVL